MGSEVGLEWILLRKRTGPTLLSNGWEQRLGQCRHPIRWSRASQAQRESAGYSTPIWWEHQSGIIDMGPVQASPDGITLLPEEWQARCVQYLGTQATLGGTQPPPTEKQTRREWFRVRASACRLKQITRLPPVFRSCPDLETDQPELMEPEVGPEQAPTHLSEWDTLTPDTSVRGRSPRAKGYNKRPGDTVWWEPGPRTKARRVTSHHRVHVSARRQPICVRLPPVLCSGSGAGAHTAVGRSGESAPERAQPERTSGQKRPADMLGQPPPAKRPAIRPRQTQLVVPAGLHRGTMETQASGLHPHQHASLSMARSLATLLVAIQNNRPMVPDAHTETAGRALHMQWWHHSGYFSALACPNDMAHLAQHTLGEYRTQYLRSYQVESHHEAKQMATWLAHGHRAALFHWRQGAASVQVRANRWVIVCWGVSPWGESPSQV